MFWDFQLQRSHGRRSFRYMHDPAFEANLSCSFDAEGSVGRDLFGDESRTVTILLNQCSSDSIIPEGASEETESQTLPALANVDGGASPSNAKLVVTR